MRLVFHTNITHTTINNADTKLLMHYSISCNINTTTTFTSKYWFMFVREYVKKF